MNNSMPSKEKILLSLNHGLMSTSCYDLSWVIRASHHFSLPSLHHHINTLIALQHKSGAWGSKISNHDRIISTLAAITALQITTKEKHHEQIKKGLDYLSKNFTRLDDETFKTIAFELVLFPLINHIDDKSIFTKPSMANLLNKYRNIFDKKIAVIPNKYIYSWNTTLIHSLEFLEGQGDESRLPDLYKPQFRIIGLSPAATCWYSITTNNIKPFQGLSDFLTINNGQIPTLYPIDVYERLWVIYNLSLFDKGLLETTLLKKHLDYIRDSYFSNGLTISRFFPVPDLDDTALGYKLLCDAGYSIDNSSLALFQEDSFFKCYLFERSPSISANIHALEACIRMPEGTFRSQALKKIVTYLMNSMTDNAYWSDKWHISPYYTTSHGIIAFSNYDLSLLKKTVDWLLSHQRKNGSWGWFEKKGTLEETALAMQGLITYLLRRGSLSSIEKVAIQRSNDYLISNFGSSYQELWNGKVLYCPINVVHSSIISAIEGVKALNIS